MAIPSLAKYNEAIEQIDTIIDHCKLAEKEYLQELTLVHPKHQASARNLIHYITYRNEISSSIKRFLYNKGLIGLKNAEAHIMQSLLLTRRRLHQLAYKEAPDLLKAEVTFKKAGKLARKNTRELLGNKSKRRNSRIMVTQPLDSAKDRSLVLQMIKAGMNTVRINCAHDTPEDWLQIIENTHQAINSTSRHVKITMDLGGPKVRTGEIAPGPKVAHLRPERDGFGRVIDPGHAGLIPESQLFPDDDNTYIPIPASALEHLEIGEEIKFVDTRGKKRSLKVINKENSVVWVHSYDSAYIQTGTKLISQASNQEFLVGEIPPLEQFILLKKGDLITLHQESIPGEPAKYDEEGNQLQQAHISCTSKDVFNDVVPGQRIVFDDGKIVGEIMEQSPSDLLVKITHAKDLGSKLKMDKGINFPESQLHISGLTDKDREDLKFVVQHADVVNMSFVNRPDDVKELIKELKNFNALHVGVVLKIETMLAVKNIVKILLTSLQQEKVGVMIARGDLAIECGWQNVGMVQEELLKICRSAHVPTIWATQVMENLAKKGVPSRAEITDAVMAQKADCVMLNKGMYILDAIRLLDTILINSEQVQMDKKRFFKEMAY